MENTDMSRSTERSVSSIGSCEHGPDFQLDVSSSLAGLRYDLERRYSDRVLRKPDATQGEIQHRGSLVRTASASSSNVCEDLMIVTRQTRLFLQLEELRRTHLADLWDVFKKFEHQLQAYKNRDACVVGVIDFHIDLLRRMIVILVASRESLATWFTEANFNQLRRQICQYLLTFKGDLFWTAFPEIVVRHLRNGLRDFAPRVIAHMDNVEMTFHVSSPQRTLHRPSACAASHVQVTPKVSRRTLEENQTGEELVSLDELTGCLREREFGSHCKRLKTLLATHLGKGGDEGEPVSKVQARGADVGTSSVTGQMDYGQVVCVDSRKLHTCGVVLGAFSYTDFRSRAAGFGSLGEMFHSLLEVA